MEKYGKIWGDTAPVFCQNNVEIHLVSIHAGGYCSKHRHAAKANQFLVIEGALEVRRWKAYGLEDVTTLNGGDSTTCPAGEWHQFRALTDVTAIEIYWTELDPADIERETVGGMEGAEAEQ